MFLTAFTAFIASVACQQIGTLTPEVHPTLLTQKCTNGRGCQSQENSVVLDANWRWTHATSSSTNCYTGNTWDSSLCPDPVSCSANCAVDGADYAGTYGITSSGDALTLKFVTQGPYSKNIGSRVYLLADDEYQLFFLKNQEFSFDVDVSNLPCGLNGALYFSQMDADGGLSKYFTNKAGARYGTGYCDAQCAHDIKFINGEANLLDWESDSNDPNSGTGKYGSCCSEMDVWEANLNAAAYTPHVCSVQEQTRCSGIDCGDGANRYRGICDKDGCDFNSYRMGNTTFFGSGKTVDTRSKFTVVTQFVGSPLAEIRRLYVQNGKVIQNSKVDVPGIDPANTITDTFCKQQKTTFNDTDNFEAKGGLSSLSTSLDAGMVLVLSLWDDHDADMLWLDSEYPIARSPTEPGVKRGPCDAASGVPAAVESQSPGASVTFSNIKYGDIGSTFDSGTSSESSAISKSSSTSTGPGPTTTTIAKYGQCGGTDYTGGNVCIGGTVCTYLNAYYSQCL